MMATSQRSRSTAQSALGASSGRRSPRLVLASGDGGGCAGGGGTVEQARPFRSVTAGGHLHRGENPMVRTDSEKACELVEIVSFCPPRVGEFDRDLRLLRGASAARVPLGLLGGCPTDGRPDGHVDGAPRSR
jgi:hypothetical protein